MGRRTATRPADEADRVARLEQRVAELETICGALARAVIFGGLAPDVHQLPGNRNVDNRADAAVIREAARRGASGPAAGKGVT